MPEVRGVNRHGTTKHGETQRLLEVSEFRVQSLLDPEKRKTGWESPLSRSQRVQRPPPPRQNTTASRCPNCWVAAGRLPPFSSNVLPPAPTRSHTSCKGAAQRAAQRGRRLQVQHHHTLLLSQQHHRTKRDIKVEGQSASLRSQGRDRGWPATAL